MKKTEGMKAFNAWTAMKEKIAGTEMYIRNLEKRAAECDAQKEEAGARWQRKIIRQERRKLERDKAKADALYTDEVKAEEKARADFKAVFKDFIEEWTIKFTDKQKADFEERKEKINSGWDAVRIEESVTGKDYWETKAYKKMKVENWGIVPFRIITEFDYNRMKENNRTAVTWELYLLNARVCGYVGTVTELTDIHWTGNGLEGIVTGPCGKAYIRAILAGGYNIQCLHIRMIVTKIS